MAGKVTLELSKDEAVVLFEWIVRFNADKGSRFEDQAEQRVLLDLEASLESLLAEPFLLDWPQVLAAARSRVRDSTE